MASRWTRIGACATIAAALGVGGLHTAHAGAPPSAPPIAVTPTTVSNGTPFTVSGAGCVDPDTQSGAGYTVIVVAPGLYYAYDTDLSGTLYALADVADDGTWTVTTAANTREEYLGPFDDFDTTVTAYCAPSGTPEDWLFQYEVVAMRYLGEQVTPTTPTSVPTSLPTAPVEPVEPGPAEPLPAQATFTG